MKFMIRALKNQDISDSLFETLRSLSSQVISDVARAREVFERIKNNPNHKIFVAIDEKGKVAGSVTLLIEQKFIRGGKFAHLEDLAVRADCQKMGIGSALVSAATKAAQEAGCYEIRLCASKELFEKFYKRLDLGFEPDGISATAHF